MKTLKFLINFFAHIERRQTKIEKDLHDLADGVTYDIDNLIEEIRETRESVRGTRQDLLEIWGRIESIQQALDENERERQKLLSQFRP